MEKIKKFVAVIAAVAILVLLPDTNAFTASAAEPVTYALRYVSDELGWRYQANASAFSSNDNGHSMYSLLQVLKDGDLVVIDNNLGTNTPLDLGDVKLQNLTFYQNSQWSMVYAGSVEDCYILGGSTGTVNCNVVNAYVYDIAVVNFNGNVDELTIYGTDKLRSSVGCAGTVGHLYARSSTLHRTFIDNYDFSAGSLLIQNGVFNPQGSYKTAEEHEAAVAALPATEDTTASSDDEYDDVPQTGQSNLYLWLLFASVICFAGSRALKRSAN